MQQKTLIELFRRSVAKFSKNPLLWDHDGKIYQSTTYRQAWNRMLDIAAGLLALGLKHGERVALLSEGRRDWLLSELSVLASGAVNVPLSVKLNEPSELEFRLNHSGCRFVIVSKGQLEKVRMLMKDLADTEKIIILDEVENLGKNELTLQTLIEKGRDFTEDFPSILHERMANLREDDLANICYTSGTTADPKGIMLTHRNYTANAEQAAGIILIPEEFISLVILPWGHAFAHTAALYTLMQNGASVASIQLGNTPLQTLKNIPKNIKEIRPHVILSVPALAKNFRKNIELGIAAKGEKIEKLFRFALKVAYAYNKEGCNRGGLRSLYQKPILTVMDRLIFSKIRENFGGRIRYFVGGGALLDTELQRFFYAIGMPMFQGYGLSEAAPVISANTEKHHKLGSSGILVPNLELRILDENGVEQSTGNKGEIVVCGANVMMGYWKNPHATEETLRGGWLYTGDLGYMDEDGFLYVLGRFKSLLIGNDGEKFSPEGIEEALADQSEYIDQVMLYNEQNPYTVALIVPNKSVVLKFLKSKGLSCQSLEGQDAVIQLIIDEINAYREGGVYDGMFPARWLPTTFALLGAAFTEENRFLNTTLKMVRGKITDFYSSRIDELYSEIGRNPINPQNRIIVSRFEE